jgi:eukaryotic translation initiation factor 2C
MEPTMKYPFNIRSFFTDQECKRIGGGLELWRGYFQSVRPAIGRILINIDISTGMSVFISRDTDGFSDVSQCINLVN